MGEASSDGLPAVAWQVLGLLVGAAGAALLSGWLRLPTTPVLAGGALLAAWTGWAVLPPPAPEHVLLLFLPPLVFDAVFRLDRSTTDGAVHRVVSSGVLGALATTAVVASIAVLAVGSPLPAGLLVGSAVAATDPGALRPARPAPMPGRLVAAAATENVAGNTTAIVVFVVLLGLTSGARPTPVGGHWLPGLLGAVLIGGLLARACSALVGRTGHPPAAMALSTGLAYGSYAIAEAAGAPGAIACLVAGLVHGRHTAGAGIFPDVRPTLRLLWSYLGFLASALAFVAAGTILPMPQLLERAWPIVAAAGAVLAVRAAVGWGWGVPCRAERIVLAWAGLRGGLATALVLGLPDGTAARHAAASLGLGVVLLTLTVQGLTLPWLPRHLRPRGGGETGSTP